MRFKNSRKSPLISQNDLQFWYATECWFRWHLLVMTACMIKDLSILLRSSESYPVCKSFEVCTVWSVHCLSRMPVLHNKRIKHFAKTCCSSNIFEYTVSVQQIRLSLDTWTQGLHSLLVTYFTFVLERTSFQDLSAIVILQFLRMQLEWNACDGVKCVASNWNSSHTKMLSVCVKCFKAKYWNQTTWKAQTPFTAEHFH